MEIKTIVAFSYQRVKVEYDRGVMWHELEISQSIDSKWWIRRIGSVQMSYNRFALERVGGLEIIYNRRGRWHFGL
jgi:hypothetical protein